jgi:hypothetical protein
MTLDHSLIEELMAVDALGGLDGDDRERLTQERASHGDCAECHAIEAEFGETAAMLASVLAPVPVDDQMIDRILATPRDRQPSTVASHHRDELAEHRTRRFPAWQALSAAAAVAVVLVVAVTTLRPSTTSVDVVPASQRIAVFESSTDATLAVAYTPGEPGAVFWGSRHPDPGEGRVYEIWMIEDDKAVSGGCVTPTDGVIALRVDATIGTTEAMAVTRETSDCPASPSGFPILSADLTVV